MTDASETLSIDAFIEARLREDEETARAAVDPDRPGTHWCWEDGERDPLQPGVEVEGLDTQAISLRTVEEYPTLVHPLPAFILRQVEARQQGALWHIARHDPARVLRQCAALRAIVTEHRIDSDPCDAHDARMESIPCDTVTAIAAIWSDHPDFRAEWTA